MLLFSLISAILGLIIGSFLNVVIYRVPRGESIVSPGSHCPVCGHYLKPWELIPVLSFLILKRRCSNCRTSISWRYAGVEILTSFLFFLTAGQAHGYVDSRVIVNFVFISFLIALTFIDLDTLRLPDVLVFPLLGVGLLGAFLLPGRPTGWESILSAAGAGGVFFLIAWFYPDGMGLGDGKLVAALGAYLGFPAIFLAIFFASLTGSCVGGILFLLKKRGFRQQIPFGPFLAFGALLSLFWGQNILETYWTFLGR